MTNPVRIDVATTYEDDETLRRAKKLDSSTESLRHAGLPSAGGAQNNEYDQLPAPSGIPPASRLPETVRKDTGANEGATEASPPRESSAQFLENTQLNIVNELNEAVGAAIDAAQAEDNTTWGASKSLETAAENHSQIGVTAQSAPEATRPAALHPLETSLEPPVMGEQVHPEPGVQNTGADAQLASEAPPLANEQSAGRPQIDGGKPSGSTAPGFAKEPSRHPSLQEDDWRSAKRGEIQLSVGPTEAPVTQADLDSQSWGPPEEFGLRAVIQNRPRKRRGQHEAKAPDEISQLNVLVKGRDRDAIRALARISRECSKNLARDAHEFIGSLLFAMALEHLNATPELRRILEKLLAAILDAPGT